MATQSPSPPRSGTNDGSKPKKSKSKSRLKRAIIENIPLIPEQTSEDHMVPYAVTPLETRGGAVALDVEGSSVCPIYVSDYEDNSEVAIRGDRKIDLDLIKQDFPTKNLLNRTKKPLDGELPPRSADVAPTNGNSDEAGNKTSSKKKRHLKKRIAKLSV
eukprot:jgi/Psemu1/312314/fgenesh1_kg.920_\